MCALSVAFFLFAKHHVSRLERVTGTTGLEPATSGETEALLSVTRYASAAGVVIISTLAILVIAMASLPVAIVAGEFGAAMAFGLGMDVIKIPVFARVRISRKPICK